LAALPPGGVMLRTEAVLASARAKVIKMIKMIKMIMIIWGPFEHLGHKAAH
jgi:hypothetical protein